VSKRIAVVGSKHTTYDFLLGMIRRGFKIDHCITLTPEKAEEQGVAGYYNLVPLLNELRIPYSHPRQYNLDTDEDREKMLGLELDLLLLIGWQRLIPDWWLNALSIGAFGTHGSSKPLPHGRGRSPMNWSLIQGKTQFCTHLFKCNVGVDDGPIVAMKTFDISPFDDCHSLHLKNTLAMLEMCREYVPLLLEGKANLYTQPVGKATYYPKRTAEDGLLYWSERTEDLYNQVRAVTRPFPGAFTFLDNDPAKQIQIWKGIPFDRELRWPSSKPGEILEVFYDGTFVVKTKDSSFLVQESGGHRFSSDDIGRHFGELGKPKKIWPNLPD